MERVRMTAGPSAGTCPGICHLDNTVQEYAWGSTEWIPGLLGMQNPGGRPFAELWMGAHPKAPSILLMKGRRERLDGVISLFPEEILGEKCCRDFSGHLPFLFKVLAAEKPLSVQVHPGDVRARLGFARENALGIPLDAPHRNYRDANHKPEILCALTPFHALKGFREAGEILELTNRLCPASLSRECEALGERGDGVGLKGFFSALLSMDGDRRRAVVSEAVASAERQVKGHPAFDWVTKLDRHYPGDVGVLSPLILNVVELSPGDAIFIQDGELHAYLSGMGLELMANSDNVLRGGLTPKHIDVPELLENVSFSSGNPSVAAPVPGGDGEEIYPSVVREFQLSRITVSERKAFVSRLERSVEILLCTEGRARIKDAASGEVIGLAGGQSVLIPARLEQYRIEGRGVIYRASVPD